MATQKSVCEQALGMLGISDPVTDITTDGTARAKALLRYYAATVESAFKAQPWNFARRYLSLTEQAGTGTATVTLTNTITFSVSQDGTLNVGDTVTIGTTEYVITARTSGTVWTTSGANVGASAFVIAKQRFDDPTEDWAYAYRVPSKVLVPRRLVDGNRTPIRSNRPTFWMGQDSVGKLLYCDYDTDVTLEYTESVSESVWPEDFAMAVAGWLAYWVSPLLTQGDPNQMGIRAYQNGVAMLNAAAASDANANVPDDEADSSFEQYRNGGGSVLNQFLRTRMGNF